jgi:hypothetical protein
MENEFKLTLIVKKRKCHIVNDKGTEIATCDTLEEVKKFMDILILTMDKS